MMDDDDHDEVRCTGSDVEIEEYTDTEESPYTNYQLTDKFFDTDQPCWQKFNFLITLAIVAISITISIITLPLYLESVSTVANGYTGLFFIALLSTIMLGFVHLIAEKISPPPVLVPNSMRIRIPRCSLIKISCSYALAGILVILSLDQNRVLCHLQDPIKSIVLVFSLVYYFFFCRKMMSLQRIFSSTTIIVGLFISVDYGLCNQFRCRGRDITSHAITIKGTWGIRAIWTLVYVVGLATFAMFFTLLELHFTTGQQNVCRLLTTQNNSFLYTVSRLVSSRDIRRRGSEEEGGRLLHVTDPDPTIKQKQFPKPPILRTLLHIHAITFVVILAFSWIDILPGIGRNLAPKEIYDMMVHGLKCHFRGGTSCSGIAGHGWIFLFSYLVFSISVLNFLSMCESAVFTIAATTISLPLSGIWWSIYKMDVGLNGGMINWSPGVTGELICALLGLPVVLLGLGLLIQSHFRDIEPVYKNIPPPDLHRDVCHR